MIIKFVYIRKLLNRKFPITAGIAVDGALVLMVPVLTAIGAMLVLLTKVKVEIICNKDDDSDEKKKAVPLEQLLTK